MNDSIMIFGLIKLTDALIVLSTLIAPLLAVQASEYFNKYKEKRSRQNQIFRSLMKTRASNLTIEHVEALNLIDIEFYGDGKKNKAVIEAWKTYIDHLSPKNDDQKAWEAKRVDLLIELLEKMAICLNYEFGKTDIKNRVYNPQAFTEFQEETAIIRKACIGLLQGKQPLSVCILNPADTVKGDNKKI